MSLQAPLVPAGVNLRSFPHLPLDVLRLRDSNIATLASAEGFRAAVLLWCAAWHQVPAASLPDDDKVLANLAGFGRAVGDWLAVKAEALQGFVECSDGRLYHPVVAEKALAAWAAKEKRIAQTQAATAARLERQAEAARATATVGIFPENDGQTTAAPDVEREQAGDDRRNVKRDVRRNVDQQNRTERNKKDISPPDGVETDFAAFWSAYPKRTGGNPRKPALAAYAKARRSGVTAEAILSSVRRYAAERLGEDPKFTAHATTWLNREPWTDEAAPVVPQSAEVFAARADDPPGWPADLPPRATMLRAWTADGRWPMGWGPEPGSGGCRLPLDESRAFIVARYGDRAAKVCPDLFPAEQVAA